MTPMRTSSLKHMSVDLSNTRTPRASKENLHQLTCSRSASPRKPLKELPSNNIQPGDIVRDDPEEFIDNAKRIIRNIQVENESLRSRMKSLEAANSEIQSTTADKIDCLQAEMERLVQENHRLEEQLQNCKAENLVMSMSPRPGGSDNSAEREIARLSDELAWHSKLHLYAEKERIRLLDLLEFSRREGNIAVKECVGLREKISRISLRGFGDTDSIGSKCLV